MLVHRESTYTFMLCLVCLDQHSRSLFLIYLTHCLVNLWFSANHYLATGNEISVRQETNTISPVSLRVAGYAWAEDKEHCEEYGRMLQADPRKVSMRAKKRGLPQLGTLGTRLL